MPWTRSPHNSFFGKASFADMGSVAENAGHPFLEVSAGMAGSGLVFSFIGILLGLREPATPVRAGLRARLVDSPAQPR